jgi:hypothetical protein
LKIWKVLTLRRMILCTRKNDKKHDLNMRFKDEPYIIINVFLAVVILLIIVYSGLFSPDKDNYPIICLHEIITGEPCLSCGLSHSFSLLVRGRIEEAYQWNIYGLRIFLFFILQLILRIAYSIFYIRNHDTRNQLIITDCIGSGLIFLISFWPFIVRIISDILSFAN